MGVVVAGTCFVLVVIFNGGSQILVLTGGLCVVVIWGTNCDVICSSSTATWSLNDDVIGCQPFISRYDRNLDRLDIIVGSVSFAFIRCTSSSPIFLSELEWSLLLMINKDTFKILLN